MKKYLAAINSDYLVPSVAVARGISWSHPMETLLKIYHHFMSDSLYRNSIYLILSTSIQAFFGFFFWIIAARLYAPEQVGIATTLISVMTLISGFSTLGLNVGLVRFLPKSKEKNEKINSSFFITTLASVVISIIFLVGLKTFSPKLLFLQSNILYMITFTLFVISYSVNALVESIFVAYRSAKYTLLKNTVLSIVKVVLPAFLLVFSAYGIYASVGIANILAFILSIGLLIYNFKYTPKLSLNIPVVKKIGSYSFANYLASFLGSLPQMLLPLIIVNKLGAKEAAYFYIALMIASFVYIIPSATTQSLFAEGSNNEKEMRKHINKAIKIITMVLIPVIIFIILFGNYILLVFGKKYSSEAFMLLRIFAFSSVFISTNYILSTLLRVKNKMKEIIINSLLYSLFIISAVFLINLKNLYDLGLIWLAAQVFTSAIYYFQLKRIKFS
ncbi:MAG TPA: oligosaccharide flippase family protein [Candidatus Acidoferrales bacterium]|nr:oligosaccharide flippase family protein [Candidatus Acidoferrales bacterium]